MVSYCEFMESKVVRWGLHVCVLNFEQHFIDFTTWYEDDDKTDYESNYERNALNNCKISLQSVRNVKDNKKASRECDEACVAE